MSLSKPSVRFLNFDPSLADSSTMSYSRSFRLTVTTAIKSPDGDGAIVKRLHELGLLGVGRQVHAVVGRPLLVAERRKRSFR